jgi:hypothetical protein
VFQFWFCLFVSWLVRLLCLAVVVVVVVVFLSLHVVSFSRFNLRSERLLYWNKQPTQSDTSGLSCRELRYILIVHFQGHSPEGIISLKFCQKIEPIENTAVCLFAEFRFFALIA